MNVYCNEQQKLPGRIFNQFFDIFELSEMKFKNILLYVYVQQMQKKLRTIIKVKHHLVEGTKDESADNRLKKLIK